MVSLACFLICVGIVCTCFKRDADILSPGRVFGFVWSLVLGLNSLKLSGIQHEWSSQSWMLLLLGIASFLVGTFIAYIQNLRLTLVPISVMRSEVRKQPIDGNWLFNLIVILFVVYLVSFLIIFLVKGTVPILGLKKGFSRTEFSLLGLGLFLRHITIIIVLVLMYHIFVTKSVNHKRMLKFVLAVSVITYLLTLQRGPFFVVGPMCFTLLYYTTRRIKFRTAAIIFLSVFLLFYFVSSLRAGEFIHKALYLDWKMKIPSQYAFITEPYSYIVMDLEYFSQSVDRLESFTYGYYTFDFLLALTGLKHWMADYFNIISNPYAPIGWKDYTALWPFYRDFGVIGLTAFPLLIGLVIGNYYYVMRSRPSLQKIIVYSIMVYVMAISFFYFPVPWLWFVYNAVVFYLVLKIVTKKQLQSS